jgi:Ca2+/H+ antiporter, TMEM165/GDT1 family
MLRFALVASVLAVVAADLFSQFDTNHDGKLSRVEFDGIAVDLLGKVKTTFVPDADADAINRVLGFWPAFVNSLMMIWATEIGDKTFFIAAIMAMRHSPPIVFSGAALALFIMTILSAGMGYVLPNLMPRKYTHYAAAGLFLYFGLRLLKDASELEAGGEFGELEEAEEELSKKDDRELDDEEEGLAAKQERQQEAASRVFWQALSLTFIAEWGDRSQIATIALAAAKDPYGVIVGGCIGHAMCTGLAVIGGKALGQRTDEKTVTKVGGIIFLLFAIHSLFFDV